MYVICDVSLIAPALVDASCAISAALGTRQGRAAMILDLLLLDNIYKTILSFNFF